MSFFPPEFNPRDAVVGGFDLVEIDTPDGVARFLAGTDGVFRSMNGDLWSGSQLINIPSLQDALGGTAPRGAITLSFFQDPEADDLVEQIKDLGDEYINGRDIRFFIQPFGSIAEQRAPVVPPLLWLTRTMRSISYKFDGPQGRSITLNFEAWAEARKRSRRLALNTEGHATLIGEANPSLELMPTDDFQEEPIWG